MRLNKIYVGIVILLHLIIYGWAIVESLQLVVIAIFMVDCLVLIKISLVYKIIIKVSLIWLNCWIWNIINHWNSIL